jgi:L-seryl-tRNA(Ser) seleniumtransferase
LPTQNLPTKLVAVSSKKIAVDALAKKLRMHEPPVVARIHDGCLLLDPRTMFDGDEQIVIKAVAGIIGNL